MSTKLPREKHCLCPSGLGGVLHSVTLWCSLCLLCVPRHSGRARIKGKGEASTRVADEGARQYDAPQQLGMGLVEGEGREQALWL